ncbi:hypothetical protein EsH8_IV_000725 [Colletotrichum jinshuiense]
MAGNVDDPFGWDVEQVVHELCAAENRPWLPKLATKRPDPEALSKELVENGIDGETLLTYEDVMPSLDGLLQGLGLTKITHKMTFVKAIKHLKSKSQGYRQFKADLVKQDLEMLGDLQEAPANGDQNYAVAVQGGSSRDILSAKPSTETTEMQEITDRGDSVATSLQTQLISTSELDGPLSPKLTDAHPTAVLNDNDMDQTTSEPPQKKRRVAPALISTSVPGVGVAPVPTAADELVSRHFGSREVQSQDIDFSMKDFPTSPRNFARQDKELGWRDDKPNAYFGCNGLITAHRVPNSSLISQNNDPANSRDTFIFVTKGLIPSGRRLQVNRAIRRLFYTNNQSLVLMQNGQSPYLEPEEEDKVLPLFGESDVEDGYDTETREAIEDEEEELQREMDLKSHHLTQEDVDRVLQEEIQKMEESWDERKLPKKQRKANELWNKARRHGLVRQIANATSRLEALNNRIDKLRREIQRDEWPTEDQLRRQARCLDSSVEDRKAERWLLDVLRGTEPPQSETMPKLRPAPIQREILSDEEGEIITSDEDEENDDFVIESMVDATYWPDPGESRPTSPMNLDNTEEPGRAPTSPYLRKEESPVETPIEIQSDDNIIDLTGFDSEPVFERNVICLDTPKKANATQNVQLDPVSDAEELAQLSDEDLDLPYNQPGRIGDIPPKVWKERADFRRLLICVLWRIDEKSRNPFFHVVQTMDPADIWTDNVTIALEEASESHDEDSAHELGTAIARLFRVFAFCKPMASSSLTKPISRGKAKKIKSKVEQFEGFCEFVNGSIVPYFPVETRTAGSGSGTPKQQRLASFDEERSLGGYSDDDIEDSPSKKRKRVVLVDQAAKDLRESDQRRLQEQEKRRKELRKKLAASDNISSDKSRLIINETKQDDQGLVYVNEDIGKRIKNHQIDGVRFMWNQIIYDSKARQGCLLAHTMGLGKTMQVITLLVAIAEAAQSSDNSIRSQIPEDLRDSKTLVLCPSLLVDNWMDEFLMWAPEGLLGQFFKLESATKVAERVPTIHSWDQKGGVMIIGYDMFKRLLDTPDEELPSKYDGKSVREIFTQSPSLVVADEAHKLKNPESKVSIAAAQFKTQSRIALTGSPLANNVVEFYYMINWVAPGYLGPPAEFQAVYAEPIQAGLYEDSSNSQFRKAKKQLAVLEATVAPKTNRATIKSCLKNDLPPKMEFVLTVPVTTLQAKLYDAYIASIRTDLSGQPSAKHLAALSNLSLIVNHPRCWQRKLTDERRNLMDPNTTNLALTSNIISEGLRIMGSHKDIISPTLSWKTQLLVAIVNECEKAGDKILVFTQSIPTLDYLDSLFRQQRRKVSRLDGKTPINQRQQLIKDFNSGDTLIYLISTNAGGVGLNIYGANRVVIFDFKYNPIQEQQAIGRAYRIGQQKPVYVYKFLSGGTFEQALHNRAVFKTQLASRVVDKENPRRWSKKGNEYLRDREEPEQKDVVPFGGKDAVLTSLLKSPELSLGIRSILMTDTFEEEDTNEILTPEDLQDVKDQIYMNSLRNSNPEKFRQLEQERLNRLGVPPSMVPSIIGIVVEPRASNHVAGLSVNAVSTPIPPPVATISAARNAAHLSTQLGPIQQTANNHVSSLATPSNAPESARLSSIAVKETYPEAPASRQSMPNLEGSPQNQAEHRGAPPMPMAGANTFFRAQQGKVTPPPADRPFSSPLRSSKQPKAKPSINSSMIKWPDQFEEKILESLDKVTDPEVLGAIGEDKSSLAKRIAHSTWNVRIEMKEGTLPDMSHMKKLCGLMENSRFAAAVLTGHLPPAQLAHASTTSGLDNMESELMQLEEQQFRNKLRLGKRMVKEPNHPQNTVNRSNAAPAASRKPIFQEDDDDDLNLLRGGAEGKRNRAPRLPTWASKAVEESRLEEHQKRTQGPSSSAGSSL